MFRSLTNVFHVFLIMYIPSIFGKRFIIRPTLSFKKNQGGGSLETKSQVVTTRNSRVGRMLRINSGGRCYVEVKSFQCSIKEINQSERRALKISRPVIFK